MIISRIGKRMIPAVIAINTMTACASAVSAQKPIQKEEPTEQTIEYNEPKKEADKNKTINLFGALGAGVLVGSALGVLGTRVGDLIYAKKGKSSGKTSNKSEYHDKDFENDAVNLFNYLQEIMKKIEEAKSYRFDKAVFYKKVAFYTEKYPSKRVYIDMFTRAVEDARLDTIEREMLAQYLIAKATCSSRREHDIISSLYPILEKTDDYEEMVSEVKNELEPAPATSAKKQECEEGDSEITFDTVHHDLTFKDVGGQDEAVRILKKNILFPIKYPEAFKNNSLGHGFLLYGPPGTGKTLIAEALANESNAYFLKLNGNELTSKWVGESEENWRKLFKEANEKQPSIIFIDEFDGIASQRGKGDVYNDKLVNQILGLLSDIEKNNSQIYIIATTNRKDMIDPAMLRSGRLGTHIELKPPQSAEDVKQILKIHLKKFSHYDKLNIDKISADMFEQNVTGADIASMVNEAYEAAMERNSIYEKMDNGTFKTADMKKIKIMPADIYTALEKFKSGNGKRTVIGFNK